MRVSKNFSPEEMQKILIDLIKYLKDIYRIWIKQKEGVFVAQEKERLRVGVIQYKLLTQSDFIKRLQKAILYLNNNPHIKITPDLIYSPPYEIEEITPDFVTSYIALRNNEVSTLFIPQKIITSNTYENRVIKGFLIKIQKAIDELVKDLKEYLERDRIKENEEYKQEIENMIENIFRIKKRMYLLLRLDFLASIPPEFELKPTPVLKYNPVYNKIYKLYQEFNTFAVPFAPGEFDLQSLDEWQLFELWVFFEIFKQCCEKFGEKYSVENWFKEEKGRIKLKIGEFEREIEGLPQIKWDNNYVLYYQKIFGFHKEEKGIGSYTISVKPDIVLWNKKNDELLIFDAKKQTVESIIYESSKEKDEVSKRRTTIAQLHQYRDSIIDFRTQRRVVKGVYAIVPYSPLLLLKHPEYGKFFKDEYRKKYGFGIYTFKILGKKEKVNLYI